MQKKRILAAYRLMWGVEFGEPLLRTPSRSGLYSAAGGVGDVEPDSSCAITRSLGRKNPHARSNLAAIEREDSADLVTSAAKTIIGYLAAVSVVWEARHSIC